MSETVESIHVLCAFDDAFAMPAAVTLRSIARTLRPGEHCVAHVVGVDLRDETRDRIAGLATDRLEVSWLEFDVGSLVGFPRHSYLNDTVYVRLFLDSLLPEDVGRVIVIDADTLVMRSLADLWAFNLGDAVVAAARDIGLPALAAPNGVTHWRRHGLEPTAPYFNAGVLLVDRTRWREAEVQPRVVEYLADPSNQVHYFDQEALNVCLTGRWAQLPLEWNAQSIHLEFVLRSGDRWIWTAVSPDEIEATRDHPAVVHFAGLRKPWQPDSRVPWRKAWLDVLDETAWAGQGPSPGSVRAASAARTVRAVRQRVRRAVAALAGR